MSLLQQAKKIVGAVAGKRAASFDLPAARQEAILNALPEPADDLERAYAQYCCQMALAGRGMRLLYQLAAMALLPVYRRRFRGLSPAEKSQPCEAIFLFEGNRGVLPDSLNSSFSQVRQISDFQRGFLLKDGDEILLSELRRRYPRAYYFRFKCMAKLAMYRYLYEIFQPKAMIVSEEYSYTSSFLTAYCRRLGVEHINVMHGEKLFYIRDSFFHFDRCYIWDEFYRELFISLRAEPTQFCVELPPIMRPWDIHGVEKTVDYTYYLQAESSEELRRIAQSLHTLRARGYTVAVRPHPVYSDRAAVQQLFAEFVIEENAEVGIEISVLRTCHVISRYSTVINQAYLNHVPFVIDDITLPQQYQKLREMRYQMLSVPHALLSEELRTAPLAGA